jgi:hypothetical protein
MSVTQHNAIIVTAHSEQRAEAAWQRASELDMLISPIAEDDVNGWCTFVVFPDGSKEGWPESDEGDRQRAKFREWLHAEGCCRWVEVSYGDEEPNIVDSHRYGDGEPSVDSA